MRKQLWILAIPLVLSIVLTGCNVMPGAQAEGHTESVEPLDPAAWPTPQPTVTQASPTPFPKITLAPTLRQAQGKLSAQLAVTATPVPLTAEGLSFTGNVEELVEQVTNLSGGFPPAAAAIVTTDGAAVRQGPADSYDSVGLAEQGELAAVLGVNEADDWLYVLTHSALQGWLPADTLQITFSLGEAPTLPPDPMAQKPPQVDSSTPGAASPLAGLEAVAVVLVTTDGVTVRQGPGISYPSVGLVERGELGAVLGTNAGRDWLYVVTISVVQGWLPVDTVRVTGSLGEAPVLPANPLALTQTAPTPPSAAGGSTTGMVQPLSMTDLKPVAKAQVNNDGLNTRQGPGAAYEQLGTLSRHDEVAVLALNKTEDWVLVKTGDGQFGWVSLAYLAVEGSLVDAPRVISPAPSRDLPSGQVAPIFPPLPAPVGAAQAAESGQVAGANASSPTGKLTYSTVAGPDLTPVTSARVNQPDVDLTRGPDITYQSIVTLSVDETVSILALNEKGDWALVKPTDTYKSPGWVLLEHLAVDGSLANAPQAITAWVNSNELSIRRGPAIFYEKIGVVAINDLVAVLGLDESRSWVLIKPVMGGGQGWIQVHFLTITGSWDDVPEAPAPALAVADVPVDQEAPAVAPAGTARQGKLVFQLSSGGDIMVINPDGTGLRRLTQGIDPALSPDGQTVAFTRWRWDGEDSALWLINVDGTHERSILGEMRKAKHPSWSPDGQHIVVNFQYGGRLEPKRVCESLLELGEERPDIPWNVNPDSVKIEIIGGMPYICWTLPPDPHWALRVINPEDGSFEDIPSDTYAYGPDWDPANSWRIASSGIHGLVQVDVNRNEHWALTDRLEDHTPVFSPDGRTIAVAFNNHGKYNIHRLNSDGGGRVPLTKTPLWVTAEPGDQEAWNNVSPAWSPDGSQIAFLTDRTGRWEIWVMNADGSNQRPMFPDEVNDQLQFNYAFVDERVLSWR